MCQAVLEGRRKRLGHLHVDTLGSICRLSMLLMGQAQYSTAETVCYESLGTMRRVLGSDHPVTLAQLRNVAEALVARGATDEARSAVSEALSGLRRRLGPCHPAIFECRAMEAHVGVVETNGAINAMATMHAVVDDMRTSLGGPHFLTQKYDAILRQFDRR